jgi:tRNA pseudouridine55 synthase
MPTIEGSHVAVEGTVNASATSTLGDGILNVNKTRGWTSHDVVAKLRGLLGVPRVGHAGTLDPAATGVLPVLVGRGTRIAEYLMDWDKEYHAVLRLGETTDTQDATGTVLTRSLTDSVTESGIRAVIQRFQGKLTQVPPM